MSKQRMPAQIRRLYGFTGLTSFQLAGASWVALLAARGFSLTEIGLAESAFHLTSLLCELPSGIVADVFGRRRTLAVGQICGILSALLMLAFDSMAGVLAAMVFSAMSYNFASGTREALAYESLNDAGRADEYAVYSGTDMIIYRISGASAMLCAGLALLIGYRKAYLLDAALGAAALALALRLRETRPASGDESVRARLIACVRESLRFLLGNARVVRLILLNAAVGALATLLRFFLQARLTEVGMAGGLLGPALFIIGMGGAVGARFAAKLRGWRYRRVWLLTAVGTLLCTGLSLLHSWYLMLACGFCAALLDDLLEVCTDVRLNAAVPSAQRATLISVASLCFSLVMIGLSPALGWLFEAI